MSPDRCEEDAPFLERSVEKLGWIKSKHCLLITGIAGLDFIEGLLNRFPKLRIIASDKEPQLIEMARCNNTRDRVTYLIADIENRETLKYWFGTARKILSYHNLERVTDVRRAFESFYDLLVPGGTVAVRFTTRNPLFEWIAEVSHRWRQFIRDLDGNFLPHLRKEYSDGSYQDMLRSIGFDILYFRNIDEYNSFKSDDHCRKFLITCCKTQFHMLPDRMKNGFVDDLFHRFGKYTSRNEHGDIVMRYRALEIFVKKPNML